MAAVESSQCDLDRLLFSERPLKALKPFFPDREAVLAFHAKQMSERFGPDKQSAECACCKRHSVEANVSFHWRGIYHTAATVLGTVIGIAAAMGGHGILPHKHIDFVTNHGLCHECSRQIKRRRVIGALVEKLCFALIILSLFLVVPMLIFAPVVLYPHPTLRGVAVVSGGLIIGISGIVGGMFAANKVVRWCVPPPLRFISKPPFQLIALDG